MWVLGLRENEINNRERVRAYNKTFPKYPNMWYDKDWILGVWNIGNNYKGSGYYGSYPPSYLKRIGSLFPDQEKILHLFSGSLPPGPYIRFDRRSEMDPDVCGEASDLESFFDESSFDIIYADPPYSEADASEYGTCLISRNKVVKSCFKLLKINGFLCWMDQVLPMYSRTEFKRVGEILITRSTNHRVRAVFIFQKVENDWRHQFMEMK